MNTLAGLIILGLIIVIVFLVVKIILTKPPDIYVGMDEWPNKRTDPHMDGNNYKDWEEA